MRPSGAIRHAAVALLVLAVVPPASALGSPRPGSLDRTFGTGGRVVLNLPGERMRPRAMALQVDGRIVIAGFLAAPSEEGVREGRMLAARFLPNGALDPSFGSGGIARVMLAKPVNIQAVAVQPDGRLVLGGYTPVESGRREGAVIRLLPDGSPDSAFGTGGLATVRFPILGDFSPDAVISQIGFQPNGKVVAAGYDESALVRLGTYVGVVRLLPDGTLDESFDDDGYTYTAGDYPAAVIAHPDGHIVIPAWSDAPSGSSGGGTLTALRFGLGPASVPLPWQPNPDLVRFHYRGGFHGAAAALRPDGTIAIAAKGGLVGRNATTVLTLSPDLRRLRERMVPDSTVRAAAVDARGALITAGEWPGTVQGSVSFARFRGPRLTQDRSFGRGGYADVTFGGVATLIDTAVRFDRIIAAAYTVRRHPEEDNRLVLVRLHAPQDGSGPIGSVRGLPTRCARRPLRPLIRVRDESSVKVAVKVDHRILKRTRRKRLRVRVDVRRLAPGGHRLVVSARDGAGNLGQFGVSFRVCGRR